MKTTAYTVFNTVNPEAYPTIKRNRLKSYNDKYYLSNNTEFQLELYNPISYLSVLCKIWINGKLISDSGIVLDSKERVYLDRYLDTAKKFKFKVFDVDDVNETKEARERNGTVKIEFYQERQGYIYTTNIGNIFNTNGWPTQVGDSPMIYNTSVYSSNIKRRTVESGRVDEGSKSNQTFSQSNTTFNTYSFHTVEFQLLPESLKPVKMKEIRNYCPECGYRLRKDNWKFCPNCGEEL
jgi:hypothetical protein